MASPHLDALDAQFAEIARTKGPAAVHAAAIDIFHAAAGVIVTTGSVGDLLRFLNSLPGILTIARRERREERGRRQIVIDDLKAKARVGRRI